MPRGEPPSSDPRHQFRNESSLGGVDLLFGGGGVEPAARSALGKRAVLPLRGGHSLSKVLLFKRSLIVRDGPIFGLTESELHAGFGVGFVFDSFGPIALRVEVNVRVLFFSFYLARTGVIRCHL